MQVTETEIIISLAFPLSLADPLKQGLRFLGLGSVLLFVVNITLLLASRGTAPIWVDVLLGGSILLGLLVVAGLVQFRQNSPGLAAPIVRISHEGIFFAQCFGVACPILITWSDISALVPFTLTTRMGRPVGLAIVPHDQEMLLDQLLKHRSNDVLARLVFHINASVYKRTTMPTPLTLPQGLLTISVDELILMIQERFASELREHSVAISEWQTFGPRATSSVSGR